MITAAARRGPGVRHGGRRQPGGRRDLRHRGRPAVRHPGQPHQRRARERSPRAVTDPAARARAAAQAHGLPRPADRAGQPHAVRAARRDRPRGRRLPVRGAVHRPRRLQDRQRHPRATPPGDQLLVAVGDRITACLRPRGPRRPARRRRVRRAARRGRRTSRTPSWSRRGSPRRCGCRSPLAGQEVRVGASIGIAPAARGRHAPTSCCATPTSRCTWPRRRARARSSCSSRR